MSVARFIADQRTNYRVPVAVCCAILGLSVGWFYKWIKAPVTAQARRRRELTRRCGQMFEASGGTYGSPRIHRTCSRRAGRWARTPSPTRCAGRACSAANPSAARD